MTVRAKMKVHCVKKWHKGSEEVEFSCIYDRTDPNDNAFAKATPQGNARLVIENEALFGHFEPGDVVLIDFMKQGG